MTAQVPVRIQTGAPVRIDGKEFSAGPVISGGRVFFDKEAGTQIVLSEIAQMRMALALRLRDDGSFQQLGSARRHTLRIDWGTFSPVERAIALQRALFVRKLDKVEPATFRAKKKVIKRIIDEIGERWKIPEDKRPSHRQVRNWYRIFVTAGRDVRALVECHWAKGRRGPRYPQWQRDMINELINERLLSHHPSTFRTVRLLANSRLRRGAAERGEKLERDGNSIDGIGKKLVERMLRERDKFEVMVETRNVREARRLAQSVQLGPQGDAVNHQWEVDHTLLDILVIDEETMQIAGRPWMTAIIDRYSRCIVGFSLSFAPPSWASVMDALRIAIGSKDWIVAGLGNIANAWDCYGVPRHLTTDHGRDFKSNSMVAAATALGFELHHAPPRKPWFKGKIERWFGTLGRQIIHTIPGTVLSKWENRKFFDADKYAVLTIEEVNWIVAKWVIDIYHQDRHSKLGRTPAQMWKRGLKDIPLLQAVPDELIVPMMGLVVPRTLRHGGIRYLGLRWDHEDWGKVRAYLPDSRNVQVRIDPLDVTHAYLYDERKNKWIQGELVEPVEARGRTLDAWVKIARLRKRIAEDDDLSREEALAKAFEEIDDYVAARVEARTKGDSPKRFADFRKRTAWSVIQQDKLDDDYKPPGDHRIGLGRIESPKLQPTAPFEESKPGAPDQDETEQQAGDERSEKSGKNPRKRWKTTPTAQEYLDREEAEAAAAERAAKEAAEDVVVAPDPSPTQWREDEEKQKPEKPARKRGTGKKAKPKTQDVSGEPETVTAPAEIPPNEVDEDEDDDDGNDVLPVGFGRD